MQVPQFFKGLFDRGRGIKPFKFKEVKPTAGIQRIREDMIEGLRQYHNGLRAGRREISKNWSRYGGVHGGTKYDAGQDTYQNENHWMWASDISPDAANSLPVRRKLRQRSRYETANNGYLQGILLSKQGDTVGSGPSLQITDPRFSPEQRKAIEKAYERHQKRIKQRRNLGTLCLAKMRDGEAFARRVISSQIRSPVKTMQRVIECDMVTHYNEASRSDKEAIDGLRVNLRSGEVEAYHVLNYHPGENIYFHKEPIEGRWVNAREVIHWFRRDRPWQRGIPETTSTIPLWALLRRYTLAVVQNAEIAADFTVLLKSMQGPAVNPFSSSGTPSQPTQADPNNWFDSFPVDRGLMTVLPEGYDIQQLDPKQPLSAYDAFVNALIQEAARPLLVPRNMAIGNSGTYNMASGALDRQLYISAVDNERLDCEEEVLDQDLEQWWYEAIRVQDYFGDEIGGEGVRTVITRFADLRDDPPEHTYRWDDIPEHHDPVKTAQAINILHMAGHLSDVDVQEGRFNRRVEDHYENLETQQQRREELGIAGANIPQDEMGFQDSDGDGNL